MMLHVRRMTSADIPLGMRIKDQAGWNQTEADWRRMLELWPEGCFVAELDGRGAGTSCACALGQVGWVAMVLVDQAVRGHGVGTQLTQSAVRCLEQQDVRAVRLDATPLGQPIYRKLGFSPEYEVARWEGTAKQVVLARNVEQAVETQLSDVVELDRKATGADRRLLLQSLFTERLAALRVVRVGNAVAGYCWWRTGSRAVQIGPAVAVDPDVGSALCDSALSQVAGQPVFIDIPVQNTHAAKWAESRGLRVQRLLTRMGRGQRVQDQPSQFWASFGPEVG
jgi:GNAT superfamily N-acetyltransferase